MSYWVHVLGKPVKGECYECGQDTHEHENLFDANYTSNLYGAWDEAGFRLKELNELPTEKCVAPLRSCIETIQADLAGYSERHNPENGWGTVERSLGFLGGILAACEAHPGGKVTVSA